MNKKYFAVIVYKIWSMSCFGNDETIEYIKIFEKEKDAEEYKNKKEKEDKNSSIKCEIKNAYF